ITINDIVAANTDVGEIKNVEEFIAAYEGEINQLDYEFKQFFQTLENSGRLDDTIIVFTADHGEEFDEHDTTAMHLSLYNEVTNVPLVFFIPGIEPVIKKDVVEIRSIPSTILDLATPLKEKLFTAPSLTQIINGTGRNDGYAIMVSAIQKDSTINSIEKVYENIESLDKIFSVGIRNEDYVYPLYSSVRTADWRLLQNPDGSLELYDQHQDPEEQSPVDISKGNNSEISKITESLLELIERNINNK
ncbi:MAG: sulfatase-like hydrolase/transferase, partial [SAR202 cluster bacterium]|nr:sulfatase-like hydrolase/transferase [SAR202 cluster bacterium]